MQVEFLHQVRAVGLDGLAAVAEGSCGRQAIQLALEGRSFFSSAVAQLLASRKRSILVPDKVEDRCDLLAERQRQIYQLLAEGKSNREIAGLLGLSLHTVETHRMRIIEKLDVHNAAELVLSAARRGLVQQPLKNTQSTVL